MGAFRGRGLGRETCPSIGVGIAGWGKADNSSGGLFDTAPAGAPATQERLDQTLDAISRRLGRSTVQRGLPRGTRKKQCPRFTV